MKEMAMNWFDVPDGVTQRLIARCGVQVAGTCPPLQKAGRHGDGVITRFVQNCTLS